MSLGLVTRASLLGRASSGFGIADQGVVWAAPCLGDCRQSCGLGGAVSKRFILKGPPCTESSFLRFGTGPGSGGSKRLIFKGRACTESSFLDFGTGPGFGEVQNGSFLKAALVQNRSFLSFGTGPGVGEPG